MERTATAIGGSIGWACQLRLRLISNGGIHDTAKSPPVVEDGARTFSMKKKLLFWRPL
ncbi:hypothetical protein [Nitrosomonas communis]|uniref:hypothetical protein n=1 Tax=Nitrosomonas communis TaxID=44574 RepID=UPI0015A5C21F|nr:hypothetical protein [Nitrosomonas communis]